MIPAVPGVEHRFLDAGGVRLHVAQAGPADAPPLVLLHGAPQHWWEWRKVIPALAAHHRVLAMDFRGWGWSEPVTAGHDGDTYARDVVALLDVLGIERAGVLGHDWGAHVAWLLGARHGERLTALMALDAPHLWVRPGLRTFTGAWRAWYTVVAAMSPGTLAGPRFVPWMLRSGGREWLFADEEVEVYAERLREPPRADAMSALYRYYHRVARRTARGAFRDLRIPVPARLLYGTQERLLWPALFADPAPASDYAVEAVAGAGHFLPEERPELVAERALAFFGRC